MVRERANLGKPIRSRSNSPLAGNHNRIHPTYTETTAFAQTLKYEHSRKKGKSQDASGTFYVATSISRPVTLLSFICVTPHLAAFQTVCFLRKATVQPCSTPVVLWKGGALGHLDFPWRPGYSHSSLGGGCHVIW